MGFSEWGHGRRHNYNLNLSQAPRNDQDIGDTGRCFAKDRPMACSLFGKQLVGQLGGNSTGGHLVLRLLFAEDFRWKWQSSFSALLFSAQHDILECRISGTASCSLSQKRLVRNPKPKIAQEHFKSVWGHGESTEWRRTKFKTDSRTKAAASTYMGCDQTL